MIIINIAVMGLGPVPGDHSVIAGFAPALGFLQSQILCRVHKSPSDETISRCTPGVRMHNDHNYTNVKDPVVRIRISMDNGNTKIAQPACTKSVRVFIMLKLDTIREKVPPVTEYLVGRGLRENEVE